MGNNTHAIPASARAMIVLLRCLIWATLAILFVTTVVGDFAVFSYDHWRKYVLAVVLLFGCLHILNLWLSLRKQRQFAKDSGVRSSKSLKAFLVRLCRSHESIEKLSTARLKITVFCICLISFSIVRGHLITTRDRGTDMSRVLSGDEGAYLLMTHSLVMDHDLNLANNREAHDGRYFGAPRELGLCTRAEPGRAYSKHAPGLSFLLAPSYGMGLLLGGPLRVWALLFLNALMALFAVVLFSVLLSVFGSKRLAFGIALMAALSAPIVYYSNHLYPEPIAALIGILLIKMIYFPPGPRWIGDLATGIMLGFLPWLHAKYILLVLPFLVLAAIERRSLRSRLFVFAPVLVSVALLMAHLQYCFRSPLPNAAWSYRARQMGTAGSRIFRVSATMTAAPGLLIDRDYGLLMWSPMYAFALPGLFLLRKRSPKIFWASLTFSLVTFLTHAFFRGWHGGWAPPVRHLVPVAGTLAIPLAALVDSRPRKSILILFAVAVAASLFGGYREGAKHLFLRQGRAHYLAFRFPTLYSWLPVFIPSELVTVRTHLASCIFALGWAILTFLAVKTAKGTPGLPSCKLPDSESESSPHSHPTGR